MYHKRNPRRRRGGDGALTLANVFSPKRVMGILPLAVTGSLSAVAVSAVPRFAKIEKVTSPWLHAGVQLLTAAIGGVVIGRMVDSRHGLIWTVTGFSIVALENIVGPLMEQVGLSAYPGTPGQFPTWPAALSAYPTMGQVPYEQRASAGMGAYLHESIPVGAPYGG